MRRGEALISLFLEQWRYFEDRSDLCTATCLLGPLRNNLVKGLLRESPRSRGGIKRPKFRIKILGVSLIYLRCFKSITNVVPQISDLKPIACYTAITTG